MYQPYNNDWAKEKTTCFLRRYPRGWEVTKLEALGVRGGLGAGVYSKLWWTFSVTVICFHFATLKLDWMSGNKTWMKISLWNVHRPLSAFVCLFSLSIIILIQIESVLCQLRLVPSPWKGLDLLYSGEWANPSQGTGAGEKVSYVLWESLSEKQMFWARGENKVGVSSPKGLAR